jgi:hypothetical protein
MEILRRTSSVAAELRRTQMKFRATVEKQYAELSFR